MTKAELLSQLENAKNNYILGLAALALFANEESYPILEKSSCKFGSYHSLLTKWLVCFGNKVKKKLL